MEKQGNPPKIVWSPDLVERFWNYQSRFPDNYFTKQFGAEIVKTIAPVLVGCEHVLDFGCGTGFLLPHLARYVKTLTGADVSEESLKFVNQAYGNLTNFQGAFSVDELLLKKNTFDAIVLIEVVEHLYDNQIDNILNQTLSLLRPGGIVIITTPNEENLALNEVYCPLSDTVFHRWQHVQSFNAIRIESFATRAGFITQKTFTTDFSARGGLSKMKVLLRRILGKKNPHLVYIGHRQK
jgi:SAM-dependent methyltransferase